MLKEPVGDLRNSLGIGLSRFGVGRWTRQTLRGCIPSLVIHGTTSGGRINTPMHQTAITADVVSSLVLHPGVGMGRVWFFSCSNPLWEIFLCWHFRIKASGNFCPLMA